MKKVIAILLLSCMLLVLSSCDFASSNADLASSKIDADERLLTVQITLPASLYNDQDMSIFEDPNYSKEHGLIDATVNEDGSVTITMTKSKHQQMLEELAASLESNFSELIEADDTPYIKEITHNEDFSQIDIKVVRSDYENSWDMTPFIVGFNAIMYQAFLEMDSHVEISLIDVDSGDTFNTVVYPDALYD